MGEILRAGPVTACNPENNGRARGRDGRECAPRQRRARTSRSAMPESPRASVPSAQWNPVGGRVRAVAACPAVRRASCCPAGGGGEPRADSAPPAARAAPLRPVFLWASTEDDGIVKIVQAEDYDSRNRLRITRTAFGWRCIPRTALYDAVCPPPAPSPAPPRRRKHRRSRARRTDSWPAPDLESHIPSHTITVHRRGDEEPARPAPPSPPVSLPGSPPPEPQPEARAPSPAAPSPPPSPPRSPTPPAQPEPEPPSPDPAQSPARAEPTPLENLLAVAELELNQQRNTQLDLEFPPERDDMGDFLAAGEPATDDAFPHKDLFETISEAHYLPELGGPHDEELLESLVEKGCEDNQILALDKLAHLVQAADYAHSPSPTANISAAQGLLHLHRTPTTATDMRRYSDEFTLEALAPPPPPPLPQEEYEAPSLAFETDAPPEPAQPVPDQSDERVPSVPNVEAKQTSIEPDLEIPIDQIKTDLELEEAATAENSSDDLENDSVELVATDLSIKFAEKTVQRHSVTIEPVTEKVEEQPRDLTMCRRSPPPRTLEPPRAPSRESDAMQSPQPSGIPAVPSSPELFTAPQTKSKQTLFLETLLSSPSPKMYTSEVTITKQLCEPINLGKHRKSASPTITSCSDEIRKLNKDFGEPQEKRLRRESSEELAKISKVLAKSDDLLEKSKKLEKSFKMMDENSPMKQLQMLMNSPDFKIPDPLLVPKDKLNDIVAAPGREIPALLIQRPELRLPEAFSYPALYQDPNILVVTFSQLEKIIETRQSEKQAESKAKPSSKSSEHAQSSKSETSQKPTPSIEGMSELDAANSAAFNQMFWLPYISQLEAAMNCAPNMDFLKMMNASGYNGANYSDLAQMFNPQSRFSQGNFPMMPPMDYENRLQFAMWQEAMSQANAAAQRAKESSKSTDVQNPYVHSTKNPSKNHSAARTSPIAHSYNNACQRGMAHNPFLQGMYPSMNPNVRPNVPLPGLQIPYFNPMMGGSQRSPRTSQQKSPTSPFYQNNNYLQSLKQQESQSQSHQRSSSTGSQESPRPRISVKSLQNLLEPTASPSTGRRHSRSEQATRRREDTEVGSTTPLGELPGPPHPHDPIHQLWHPLFGNQKAPGYTSPWSWSTVTATGD